MQQFLIVFVLAAAAAVIIAHLLAGFVGRLGFPIPDDARRIGCIDGLRGILALAVVIHHTFIWIQSSWLNGQWSFPPPNVMNQLGAGAVALFFMTTGLVFYPRLLAGLSPTSWLQLYVTRVFRIVPLTAVSVILVTALIIYRTHAVPDIHYIGAAARWITAWSEVPLLGYYDSGRINSYVLWSLWYEWLFYILVLPILAGVMSLMRHRQLPTWIAPTSLLCIGIIGQSFFQLSGPFWSLVGYLPTFAIGMLAYELQSRPAVRNAISKPSLTVFATAALLVGMTTTHSPDAVSIPLFGFFFVSVACGNSLGGVLDRRNTLVLGECSFGIYLLHGIVLDALFIDTRALTVLSPLWLSCLLPIAAIAVMLITPATYLLVERPAIRQGKSLARWIAASRIASDHAGRRPT